VNGPDGQISRLDVRRLNRPKQLASFFSDRWNDLRHDVGAEKEAKRILVRPDDHDGILSSLAVIVRVDDKYAGSMRLTFKKAFGIQFVPAEMMLWLIELGDHAYAFTVDKTTAVTISRGQFGRNEREKWAIDQFLPSGSRPFERELITLDVLLEIDSKLPDDLLTRSGEHGAADSIVEPHIRVAFHAVRALTETYRDCKYAKYRETERWKKKETLLPRVSEAEFRTFLFYVLESNSSTFVGSFSEGQTLVSESSGGDFSKTLQSALKSRVPAERKLIQIAWERLFDEDFSGAAIYAAISIERVMSQAIREELVAQKVGTDSQIGKVVDDTSNRVLCTIVLGLLGIADPQLRERMVAVFQLRNALAHGQKASVKQEEAQEAVDTAEAFLSVIWK
jgi:hypothetical protein